MVFQGKLSISFFDLIKASLSADSQNFVCIVNWVWVVLIEEILLLFVHDAFLIEEPLEGRVGIFQRILSHENIIVLSSFVSVGKDLESFSNFMELSLGRFPMLFVFVRMPFSSQFFIGALDLKEGGVLRDAQDFIVVFEVRFATHFYCFLIDNH
jgi:hypothetical protein